VMQTYKHHGPMRPCHDHKFAPIQQGDYYALQAVFAGLDRANAHMTSIRLVNQGGTGVAR